MQCVVDLTYSWKIVCLEKLSSHMLPSPIVAEKTMEAMTAAKTKASSSSDSDSSDSSSSDSDEEKGRNTHQALLISLLKCCFLSLYYLLWFEA